MEYVHAALLLHDAGQKIDAVSVKKVLEAAGTKPDEARIKALVASLEGVNIEEAIEKAATPVAAPAPAATEAASKEEKKEEKKEAEAEEKKEEAAAGLGALFG